jgi:predicted PhzF superfamily epimerase YddE/YHI9
MKIPIYQVDAFTSGVFSGNPASVCMLDAWIDDKRLQSIAAENNLSETAFLVALRSDPLLGRRARQGCSARVPGFETGRRAVLRKRR